MRSLLAVAAAVALFLAAGACGSQITVPDQGVIVLGCRTPSFCYKTVCSCNRADTAGPPDDKTPVSATSCVVTAVCDDHLPPSETDDPGSCYCPEFWNDAGTPEAEVQCEEPSMLCAGRGPVCPGAGAFCLQAGATAASCAEDTGDPPQLVPVAGQPTFEPRCQFADDFCCPGTEPPDLGVPETD